MYESGGHDVLGQAVQPVRPLATPGCPPRCEPLVAPPTQQQGLGAQRLVELDLGPRFAVLVPNLAEPAAVPEALVTGRVLADSVERDVLADHDLSHLGPPFIGLLLTAFVEAAAATKTERRISSRPDVISCDAGERKSWCEDPSVTGQTLARARAGDEDAFRELTDPYQRELQLHIYRIVGSAQDAEDVLQETLLAAWRGLEQYEGRASVRAWLYRIATNRCLNALRDSGRRPRELPAPTIRLPEPTRVGEPVWLEPYPDSLLDGLPDGAPGPDAIYDQKEAITVASVTALQLLPPRQRAVLVLRAVLGYSAAEVAY